MKIMSQYTYFLTRSWPVNFECYIRVKSLTLTVRPGDAETTTDMANLLRILFSNKTFQF